MMFNKIARQDKIQDGLINMVQQNRLPHALLFAGKEGVGKLAVAISLAQFVNCSNPTPQDSCGVCPSCSKFNKLEHPDLHFVFPIVKKDNPTIKLSDHCIVQWREQVLENPYFSLSHWMEKMDVENQQPGIFVEEAREILLKLYRKTFEADYKTMIIWLPERMHTSCANKLLKILEEPFPKTLIILVSEAPELLLPTILSRVQIIRFPKLKVEAVQKEILEKYGLSMEQSLDIAKISDGSLANIRQLLDTSDSQQQNFDLFVSLMRLTYKKDIFGINKWVEDVVALGRERQKTLLKYIMRLMRENFILNMKESRLNCLTNDEKNFSEKFSPFINERNVFEMYEETGKTHFHIERNGNGRIVFFDFAIKLILLLKK